MSQRQSRQAKHIQSIQKIFTEYDDKLQMRTSSPQSTSPYPSSRFAIHRKKSPNGTRRNNNNMNNMNNNNNNNTKQQQHIAPSSSSNNNNNICKLRTTTLAKAKSLNSSDITSPVTSIGSMFDKKSSIADLHKNNLLNNNNNNENEEDMINIGDLTDINIPDYNTEIILNKFESETKRLNEICTNYESLQQSLSQIVREQSICIKQLLNELDKKNNKIKKLQEIVLKQQEEKQINHNNIHQTQFNINNTNINNMNNMNNINNININRKFQKHRSVNMKSMLSHNQRFNGDNNNNNNDEEYEQIIRHVPIHNI